MQAYLDLVQDVVDKARHRRDQQRDHLACDQPEHRRLQLLVDLGAAVFRHQQLHQPA